MSKEVVSWQPRKVTLYDALVAKGKDYERLANTPRFRKLIEDYNQDFSTKYPHFGFIFNQKMKSTIERNNLIDYAVNNLNQITEGELPWYISQDIIEHLDSIDLKHLNQTTKDR